MTYLAVVQSDFSPNKIHTASKTITTPAGGLLNPFTCAISFLFIVFKASSASFRAGRATANYASASFLIISIS